MPWFFPEMKQKTSKNCRLNLSCDNYGLTFQIGNEELVQNCTSKEPVTVVNTVASIEESSLNSVPSGWADNC